MNCDSKATCVGHDVDVVLMQMLVDVLGVGVDECDDPCKSGQIVGGDEIRAHGLQAIETDFHQRYAVSVDS